MSEVQPFYVSFGSNHARKHKTEGRPYISETGFVLVWAEDYADARRITIKNFGSVWCGLYMYLDVSSDDTMVPFFPDGVTKTIGCPISVIYRDSDHIERTAMFENYVEADIFAQRLIFRNRITVEGADVIVRGPGRHFFGKALQPFT